MSKDIIVERVNASKIRLYIEDEGIMQDIYEFFQFDQPGFQRNKWTKWDGRVRLFNKSTGLFPYGLLNMLTKLGADRGWTFDFDERFQKDYTKVTKEELNDWIKSLDIHSGGKPIEPYDYQLEAVYLAIRYGRMTLLAATSAGKSLICYILTRYYEMLAAEDEKKILIIVPSQLLVEQMYADFKDYSSNVDWDTEKNVHYIMEGRPKNARKQIYLSTWQSIYEESEDYFQQFGSIICDEVHGASGDSIGSIMGNSKDAYRRVGMTGTLKNDKINPLMVTSHFGPVKRVVTTRELIDAGRATETCITMMQLDYADEERNLVKDMSYQQEIEFLIGHAYRNKVIQNLAKGLKGNTLILFDRKDAHLHKVKDQLSSQDHNKLVVVIDGDVESEDRAAIKKAIEAGTDIVLLATYGTMSTGVSIKKLHNLVFAHPSKSIIRVLQSVGRLLRLHDSKDIANIYDLCDNFNVGTQANFALRHALIRLGFYRSEQHKIKPRKIQMKTHESEVTSLM